MFNIFCYERVLLDVSVKWSLNYHFWLTAICILNQPHTMLKILILGGQFSRFLQDNLCCTESYAFMMSTSPMYSNRFCFWWLVWRSWKMSVSFWLLLFFQILSWGFLYLCFYSQNSVSVMHEFGETFQYEAFSGDSELLHFLEYINAGWW